MPRGALHFSVFALMLGVCARVFAHGMPPQAYAVLSQGAEGPDAVSFSAGVALRRAPQRFQFACPAAWGDQFAGPLAALADGTVVVGATRGLMLLDQHAALREHPDPAAVGRSNELVRSALGVFALRPALEGSEVLAVDAATVRVLWRDTKSWSSLAVLDDKLVLVRALNRIVEMVTIAAADGGEIERQSALLDFPLDYVFARSAGSSAYLLAVFRNGMMTLGSLSASVFTKLADGELSIAGPLRVANATLLALDGKLVGVVDGLAVPLADDHGVVCLAERDGVAYACDRAGISRVSDVAVGEPLFRFDWLLAPALELLPEGEARMLCNMQWQDLLLDMQLSMPSASSAGAGGAQAAAAGVGADGPALKVDLPVEERGTSCAIALGRRQPRIVDAPILGFLLALTVVRCRRVRRVR